MVVAIERVRLRAPTAGAVTEALRTALAVVLRTMDEMLMILSGGGGDCRGVVCGWRKCLDRYCVLSLRVWGYSFHLNSGTLSFNQSPISLRDRARMMGA